MKIIKKVSIIIFLIMLLLICISNTTKAAETDIQLPGNKTTNEKIINIETKERESSLNNQNIPSLEELEGYPVIDIVIDKNTNANTAKTPNENLNKKMSANTSKEITSNTIKDSNKYITTQRISSPIKIEEKIDTNISKENRQIERKNTIFPFIMLTILVILMVTIALYGNEYKTIYA